MHCFTHVTFTDIAVSQLLLGLGCRDTLLQDIIFFWEEVSLESLETSGVGEEFAESVAAGEEEESDG